MKTFLTMLAVFGLCVAPVFSHGGTYRGPGDTVPPGGGGSGGGGGPATPGPGAPGNPAGGTSPLTPGPRGPGTPGGGGPFAGPVTGGGAGSRVDLAGWSFWWEFNKDPYLSLKDKIYSHGPDTGSDGWFLGSGEKDQGRDISKPSGAEIRESIVPVLVKTLGEETNNDIITGCLMALAKIGNQEEDLFFGHFIIPFLTDKNL